MNVEFEPSFARDLRKIDDKDLARRVERLIDLVERSDSLSDIPDLRKLRGANRLYRIRLGSYRVGLIFDAGKVVFVRFLHRSEIYNKFP